MMIATPVVVKCVGWLSVSDCCVDSIFKNHRTVNQHFGGINGSSFPNKRPFSNFQGSTSCVEGCDGMGDVTNTMLKRGSRPNAFPLGPKTQIQAATKAIKARNPCHGPRREFRMMMLVTLSFLCDEKTFECDSICVGMFAGSKQNQPWFLLVCFKSTRLNSISDSTSTFNFGETSQFVAQCFYLWTLQPANCLCSSLERITKEVTLSEVLDTLLCQEACN